MSFPKRNIFYFPKGWKDKGEVGIEKTTPLGTGFLASDYLVERKCCSFCRTIAHIGIENGNAFLFCPTCERKLK